MRRKKPKAGEKSAADLLPDADQLLSNPVEAADQIDAILYFVHKRYAGNESAKNIPSLNSFLIHRAVVIFSPDVDSVVLEKRPEQNVLVILAPPVRAEKEEERRITLLNHFGDLLIKFQKQAYDQIREMLIGILDAEGKEILVSEFLAFKRQHPETKL